MGRYNPNLPHLLGQEWVPIGQEEFVPSPSVATVERGYRLVTQQAYTLTEGRYYIPRWPDGTIRTAPVAITVYQAGDESRTGPVKSVIIPCNAVGVTGDAFSSTTADMLRGVASPADRNFGSISNGGTPQARATFYFNTNAYSQLLNGKRILAVNYLYELNLGGVPSAANGWATSLSVGIRSESNNSLVTYASLNSVAVGDLEYDTDPNSNAQIRALYFGEVTPAFNIAVGQFVAPVQIWNYEQLRLFEVSSGVNRLSVEWKSGGINPTGSYGVSIGYSALQVFFCEETRFIQGVRNPQDSAGLANNATVIPLKNVAAQTSSPSLPAGAYTVTFGPVNEGVRGSTAISLFSVPYPAIRELYPLRNQEGIEVVHPYPMDASAEGLTFTSENIETLTPISLHTSTGPIWESHDYSAQVAAQVYGSITATQEIYDANIGGSFTYPQVRYYARRFGDTTVPLKLSSASPTVSGAGMAVTLTPAEFDALEPQGGIINGWKEVTLQFPTAPTMGAGMLPRWDWSAASELAGNRWEILGVAAPATTGFVGNSSTLTEVSAAQRLGSTTYGAPVSGAAVNLGWVPGITPLVSATTDDLAADAVLIFSQNPPSITGFSIGMVTQAVTGIGQDCGGAPCCIPTGIPYQRLSWTPPYPIVCDQFARVTANGWNSYVPGLAWTVTGGSASEFSTNGSAALITPGSAVSRYAWLGTANDLVNYDTTVAVNLSDLTLSTTHHVAILGRFTTTSSHYRHRIQISTAARTAQVMFDSVVGGVVTTTSGITKAVPMTDNAPSFYLRARAETTPVGSFMRTKWWMATDTEPDEWDQTIIDNNLSTGQVGVYTSVTLATVTFDDFLSLPVSMLGSSYELQRMDPVDSWQTIMSATDLCTQSFNDYESRVGLINQYRIRTVNQYNFAGTWTTPVSGMLSSPGVSGAPCIGTTGGVLIFTSNASQEGLYNLAYVPVWNAGATPTEEFGFPEAGTVTFGRMYNRNNQVAFKPLERGGEVFSRTLLVQAAAVSPPRLANVVSLRDMAWADLPYVCVRNDIGDRWFASVQVPDDRVQRSRTLYYASVLVTKVTDTPEPVSP